MAGNQPRNHTRLWHYHSPLSQSTLRFRPGRNTEPRAKTRGAGRLLQILLSEAAHLIWILRCERTIPDPPKEHTVQEITARWFGVINTRLTEDKLAATKIKRNDQAISTARETWEPVLKRSLAIPNDWLHNREVLVGRRTLHLALEGDMI